MAIWRTWRSSRWPAGVHEEADKATRQTGFQCPGPTRPATPKVRRWSAEPGNIPRQGDFFARSFVGIAGEGKAAVFRGAIGVSRCRTQGGDARAPFRYAPPPLPKPEWRPNPDRRFPDRSGRCPVKSSRERRRLAGECAERMETGERRQDTGASGDMGNVARAIALGYRMLVGGRPDSRFLRGATGGGGNGAADAEDRGP